MTHTTGTASTARRRAAGGAAAVLAAALLFGHAPAAAAFEVSAADGVVVTDLGPAISTANVRSAEFGTLPDGTDVVFALSNGSPATFSVVDMSGERLFADELDGYTLGGFATQAEDGTVYFTARNGTSAALFTFDPATRETTELDVDLQGQRVLYEGTLLDDVLYFGTYPDAMLMGYDTAAGELRSYGSLTDDAAYVFSVGVVGDEVWAGTGPVPHLFRVDPQTGATSELLPPEHVMDNTSWFIGIEQRDDHVFVRLSPRGTYDMAVYHLAEERWLDVIIEGTFDTPVTPVVDGKVYYLAGSVLTGFDLETEEVFSTGFEDSWVHEATADAVGTYELSVVAADDEAWGPTIAGINTDGTIWSYDVATREGELVPADVLGSPAGAHSMGVGPDGAVYLGAYLSSGAMSRIDPVTQEIEHGRGPKQGDAIISHGDQLVISSYPGAGVHVGPVDGGWDWSRLEQVMQLERGEPYFQDRIFAMVSTGDRIAVGSVPDYGRLGGALTVLDPTTGEFEVHRNVVQDQSVTALAHRDGLVFGGTSIHGGIDSEPTASAAEVFVWDVAAAELVTSDVVVDGATVVDQLTVGPDGRVWGLTDTGVVFVLDPDTHEVVEHVATGLRTSNVWGRTTSLYLNPHDGAMYGNAGGALFRIDPTSLELEILVDSGVRESAVDSRGQVYFAGSVNVHALTLAVPAPECDVTVTGDRRGPLRVAEGTTCVTDADLRGPVTVAAGAGLVVTDSQVRGPVRADGADLVEITGTDVRGPVSIARTTGRVAVVANDIAGPVTVSDNTAGHEVVVAANTVRGPLSCTGNRPAPVGGSEPNSVTGPVRGQCVGL